MNPPPQDDGVDALRARLAGGATSEQLVAEVLRRQDAVNPWLNAIVASRPERAMAEARAANTLRTAGGRLPPLLGLPCTIKEFIAVEGMPWTAGLVARRGQVASRDAEVVTRLKAAGAIVVATTNGPEGGLWAETTNPVYGRTNNPWDPGRTPGGSSGGEAAIIAAGASPFGLGSDIGGSIRLPAALCGVAGHKPTAGRVPIDGHHPDGDPAHLTIGPLARRVADLATVLGVIDGTGEAVSSAVAAHPASTLRILVPEQGLSACTAPIRAGLEAAAEALSASGARVERIDLPELDGPFWMWATALVRAGYPTYAEVLGDGDPTPVWQELLRTLFGASRHSTPPLLVAAVEQLTAHLDLLDVDAWADRTRALDDALRRRLGDDGVLLLPTWPREAPRHGHYALRFTDSGWCGFANALGLPATTVPVGLTDRGLPRAAQLVGLPGADALTLAAAACIEDHHPPLPRPAAVADGAGGV